MYRHCRRPAGDGAPPVVLSTAAMIDFDRTLPPVLAALHRIEFDDDDADEVDFEAYSEFSSAKETRSWLRAWTGNQGLTGEEYRIFGQDGTGGYAAFWLTRPGVGLLEQPIVFFGSEGELAVIATDFADYLWLLAGGFGPLEAAMCPEEEREPNAAFTAFAREHASGREKSPQEVIRAARAAFPTFAADVRAMCR